MKTCLFKPIFFFYCRNTSGFQIYECTGLKEFEQIFQNHRLFDTYQTYIKDTITE